MIDHSQKIEELRKSAHLLGPKDKRLLSKHGVDAYDKIFDFPYKNIFLPTTEFESNGDLESSLVRLFYNPENIYLTCKYLFGVKLGLFQIVTMQTLIKYKFPMLIAARGFSKSFLLALFIMYIMTFDQGTQIVVAGSGLRQSTVIFRYIEKIYLMADVFRNALKVEPPKFTVTQSSFRIGDSFAVGIPIGDGRTVRGLRASRLIVDEFSSLPEEIYHEVIEPFGSVSTEPIERVEKKAQDDLMKVLGFDVTREDEGYGNQSIIAGTASYGFEHFANVWRRYKSIINSGGDQRKLADAFPDSDPPDNFDWRNYAIIRMPVELLPEGFMDQENVDRAKATSASAIFGKEFGACFISDSTGFFRRTVIEMATATAKNDISFPSCGRVSFEATLRGNLNRKYVIAIDPAAQIDNFAVVILEIWPDHRRIVYCWTINKKKYKTEAFYTYCAKKIIELIDIFPTDCVAIDSQGGGWQLLEQLHTESNLGNRTPIWETMVPGEPKEVDRYPGRHIVQMISFSSADWIYHANHDLKSDLENKFVLFPSFNAATLVESLHKDKMSEESGEYDMHDNYEKVTGEIEELKNELTTIEHTKTPSGRDHFDVPKIRGVNSRKGKLRKDRYSALLMANACGRLYNLPNFQKEEVEQTGFAVTEEISVDDDCLYHAPHWYHDEIGGFAV